MLLNYLRIIIGAPYISDLTHSTMWKQVLIGMLSDTETCEMFSIADWQEALFYLKGEELTDTDYHEYLKRLIQ